MIWVTFSALPYTSTLSGKTLLKGRGEEMRPMYSAALARLCSPIISGE